MEQHKISLKGLILMIFTTTYGFANMPRSFYLMGYAAIPWYILAGLIFFVPFAFIIAEFGAAYKESSGGIYTWMSESSGVKYAFMVTLMWYASYIVLMVNVSSNIWIVLSNAIFGVDNTQTWSLFGLDSVKTLGLLAMAYIVLFTFLASKGLKNIQKITVLGGLAVMALNLFLWLGGLTLLYKNGGTFQQPLSLSAFVHSPNSNYLNPLSIISFVVYAIFAYGGLEAIGGMVDKTEDSERTFPKGVTIAAIIITIGYAIGILFFGIFTNWEFVFHHFADEVTNLGNVSYISMNHMGYQLGLAFGASELAARQVGLLISRFMGLSMLFAYSGAFITLIYSPLRQLITGTPKKLWPTFLTKEKDGIYVNAMLVQMVLILGIIFIVSFGGESAQQFYEILVAMTNVSITLPYFFIAYSYLKFKKNDTIYKPFERFNTLKSAQIATFLVCGIVGFGNLFTIIEPAILRGDYLTTFMSVLGPLLFVFLAVILLQRAHKKYPNDPDLR